MTTSSRTASWALRLVCPWPLSLGLGLGAILVLGGCGLPEHNNVAIAACPDGRSVVFAAADGALHRLNLDTNEVIPIATNLRPARQPAVSPDGKDVVYAAAALGEEGTSLYIQPLTGAVPAVRLTREPGVDDSAPAFAPDGRIAFVRARTHRGMSMGGSTWEDADLLVIARDGSNPRRVGTRTFKRVDRLCFAEGGTRIVLGGSPDWDHMSPNLFRAPTDGPGEFEPFAVPNPLDAAKKGGAAGTQPAAAADGQLIVAISDRAAPFQYDAILLRPDGTVVRSLGLTKVSSYNSSPIFLPGGKEFLFLADSPALGSTAPHYALWRINLDGTAPRKIAGPEFFSPR